MAKIDYQKICEEAFPGDLPEFFYKLSDQLQFTAYYYLRISSKSKPRIAEVRSMYRAMVFMKKEGFDFSISDSDRVDTQAPKAPTPKKLYAGNYVDSAGKAHITKPCISIQLAMLARKRIIDRVEKQLQH